MTKYTDGGKKEWDRDLDLYLMAYRSSRQNSTQYTPFELVYGEKMRLPSELDLPMGGESNSNDLNDGTDGSADRVLIGRRGLPIDEEVSTACERRAELLVGTQTISIKNNLKQRIQSNTYKE